MEIKEAQLLVDEWIKTVGVRYFSELTNMALLTEEVGEVARIIARRYGDHGQALGYPHDCGQLYRLGIRQKYSLKRVKKAPCPINGQGAAM